MSRQPEFNHEDAHALLRAARGDRAALLELYDRHSPTLLAVASRIMGSTAEGEEILQDVMLRAWQEAHTYDATRGSVVAWLVTLTRNRSIDVLRSRARRGRYEEAAAQDPPAAPLTPELEVSESERAQAVRRAFASLNSEQRKALELAYFSGLSHSEIAQTLGQPLGTVKTRIAQAVRRLREELEGLDPGAQPSRS